MHVLSHDGNLVDAASIAVSKYFPASKIEADGSGMSTRAHQMGERFEWLIVC